MCAFVLRFALPVDSGPDAIDGGSPAHRAGIAVQRNGRDSRGDRGTRRGSATASSVPWAHCAGAGARADFLFSKPCRGQCQWQGMPSCFSDL